MKQSFTQQTPISFSLNRRTHSVSSWKELVHELIEDLLAAPDWDESKITDSTIPGSDRKIIYRNNCPGEFIRLSNGLLLPWDYTEQEYAAACRFICIAYLITPCEMSIVYSESLAAAVPNQESAAEPLPEAQPQDESELPVEVDTTTEAVVNNSFTGFEKKLQNDFQIEPVHSSYNHISSTEEKWLKLMLENETERKPSDRIQMTAYNEDHEVTTELPDWDNILDHLQNDRQAQNAAKLMKKAGIKAPVMNFRGIKEHNKVGGEALFVWMDEGIAYLHGRQKYSRGYFYERGFTDVIMDDPRELLECFRNREDSHE